MRRFTGFQRGIVVVFLLGFLGITGYQYLLSRSMRTDQATLRHLDEEVMQSPEMVSLTEKIERDRLLAKAIQQDDVVAVARFFADGVTSRDVVARQPITVQAAHHGAEKVMGFLIAQGADINAPDSGGHTPLMEAIRRIHPVVVEMLLKHGARADATDKNGRTALMCAGIRFEPLPDGPSKDRSGGGMYGTLEKPKNWNEQTVERILPPLLARGAKVDVTDKLGVTAIQYAASSDQIALVRFLLDHGADPDKAFMSVVGSGNVEILQLLLERGANRDKKWPNGDTALAHAKRMEKMFKRDKYPDYQRYSKMVQVLLKAGAKE